jgi:hypothetical protein
MILIAVQSEGLNVSSLNDRCPRFSVTCQSSVPPVFVWEIAGVAV